MSEAKDENSGVADRTKAAAKSAAEVLYGGGTSVERTFALDVNLIDRNPFQPRRYFDPEKILALGENLKEVGQIQPIAVQAQPTGRYILISGERRWRGCIAVGLSEIVAINKDGDLAELAFYENNEREDLHVIEEALFYQTMQRERDYTQRDLVRMSKKPQAEINRLLSLLKLPEEWQEEAMRLDISKSALVEVATAAEEDRAALWERAKTGEPIASLRRARQAGGVAKTPAPLSGRKLLVSVGKTSKRMGELISTVEAENTPLEEEDRRSLQELRDRISKLLGDEIVA
jgi:ParB family chromosome partitioning protein